MNEPKEKKLNRKYIERFLNGSEMQLFAVFYLLTGASFGMPITDQIQQWMSSKIDLMTRAIDELRAELEETMQENEDMQDYMDKVLDEVDDELEKYDY